MPHSSTASSLISAHVAAVQADEAMFDEAGYLCVDGAEAEATQKAEQAAFIAMVDAPCASPYDVAAKVEYFLNGTVGDRSSLIEYLSEYGDGDDLTPRLLQSLVVAS